MVFVSISDDRVTKIYEYAHEYQIDIMLSVAEDRLCKITEDKYIYTFDTSSNTNPLNEIIALLLFAEKYSLSKLISTAVDRLSAVPGYNVRARSGYRDLTSHSKFMIADSRLKQIDRETYLTKKK